MTRYLRVFTFELTFNILIFSNCGLNNAMTSSINSKGMTLFSRHLLKISYFKEVVLINSIYFDKINLNFKNKKQKRNHIIYIDTHFDHPDRLSREGKISANKQNTFYDNLEKFLKNISQIYKMPVKISKHPSNNSRHEFYKSFEISKINTDEEIFDSEIIIFTVSSAVLNAVI